MKRKSILYYPNIEPDVGFLRKHLLFFDTISRIVPKDVPQSDSYALLLGDLRDYIIDIPPEPKALQDIDLYRLEKAFSFISNVNKKFELKMNFEKDYVTVPGYSFTHRDKTTMKIMDLLEENKLINYPAQKALEAIIDDEKWVLIDTRASILLLSSLARQIALNQGIDTITDDENGFILNSLNSKNIYAPEGTPEGVLASSLIEFKIPEGLEKLPMKDYLKLRDDYKDIRSSFQMMVHEMSGFYRLEDRLNNPKEFRDAIENIIDDFSTNLTQFEKDKRKTQYKRWIPFIVGTLAGVVGTALPDYKDISQVAGVVSITTAIIQEFSARDTSKSNQEITMDLLSKLDKKLDSRKYRAFI